jgi:hypothetical protein
MRVSSGSRHVLFVALTVTVSGCLGNGGSAATTSTTRQPPPVSTTPESPEPAPITTQCPVTGADVAEATGLASTGEGRSEGNRCIYEVRTERGPIGRITVKMTTTREPEVIEELRASMSDRVPADTKPIGNASIIFKADPSSPEVPGFVMTDAGLADIRWRPGATPESADTKIVIQLAELLATKLATAQT